MTSSTETTSIRPCWFVGASFKGEQEDQTDRFVQEGIWLNGFQDRLLDEVKSIRPGDRIAIKSSYARRKNLPFDNRGNSVAVMAIKATGIVTENLNDGRTIKVDWTRLDPHKEWYFSTFRTTLKKVLPGDWKSDGLINFAFHNIPQDIDQFRNSPQWAERFGDRLDSNHEFTWTSFYESMADGLLRFRDRRDELIAGIHVIGGQSGAMTMLNDQYEKGIPGGLLKDICPFTAMAIFNRGITESNRKDIAEKLADFLGVSEPVPKSFTGIPIVNNQRTWFFGYSYQRQPDDIDALWEVFSQAISFADSDDPETQQALMEAYDNVAGRFGVGWNLTMGFYWARPWTFATVDKYSRTYIEKKLKIKIDRRGPKKKCSGSDYLKLVEKLEARFEEDTFPVHSFPELSYAAWVPSGESDEVDEDLELEESAEAFELVELRKPDSYSIDDILKEGSFLDRTRLEDILERLKTKKNIVLQGPPGTGKTWLAKRLGYALMGARDERKLRAVQFHPNLSYEDFVRGWRPSGDGKLALVDGPFMEMVEAALDEPGIDYVMVIEEINRGNPAQIFGEVLTLLEADKRTPSEALELSYRRESGETVYVPSNLYVIGTMNIADRSLALVDFALRRRFAFIDLEPVFGRVWREWVSEKFKIDPEILQEIESRMRQLNEEIAGDSNLGPQFKVGHSYVTPPTGADIRDARKWFRQVATTEIGPLLNEYWFDSLDKARKAVETLLEGF